MLYACESGSRGWGFASPHSDYDVRFLYVHEPEWYLRVEPQRDLIEKPIDDELDVSGGEIRKALQLLREMLVRRARTGFVPGRDRVCPIAVMPICAAERVLALAEGPVEMALDTAPVNVSPDGVGALPELARAAGGEPRRVLTIVDFAGAAKLGGRTSFDDNAGASLDDTGMPKLDAEAAEKLTGELRYAVLGEFAELAARGQFSIPIARTLPLPAWREALALSLSGQARGKLVLLPGAAA